MSKTRFTVSGLCVRRRSSELRAGHLYTPMRYTWHIQATPSQAELNLNALPGAAQGAPRAVRPDPRVGLGLDATKLQQA